MGLDMYLRKKTYVGANYEHRKVNGKIDLSVGDNRLNIKFSRVSYIVEEVGYWRKANQIHAWFVENVQNGVDECQESYVSKEDLIELRDICRTLNKSKSVKKAEELLPTQQGFFFGSEGYDEYYFEDIKETLKVLNSVIKEIEKDDAEIYYQASW